MTSILYSVKKMLGLDQEYTVFDSDIIFHINTVFTILTQLGVGPTSGFSIVGSSETWSDFLGTATNLESVKSYMYLKVKMLFDPPQNSAVKESMNNMIAELEWRIGK